MALALDFRSISATKAVLYDAPSAQSKKVYLLGQGYPVEVIVNLGDWLKVRDKLGGLNWVEARYTSTKRTVLVALDKAEIKQASSSASQTLAYPEKDVVLDLVSTEKSAGWVEVKHRDGLVGFMPTMSLWGL